MKYRYTDKDADTLGFRSKLDRELFVTANQAGVYLPRAEVVKLTAELQKWLEETPKELVKTTVPLSEIADGETFEFFGASWERSHLMGSYVACVDPAGLSHKLWPSSEVEVMREAVVSEPEVQPEPVAPRRTPGPETSSRKAKVRVDSLPKGTKVLVEMTVAQEKDYYLQSPLGTWFTTDDFLVTPV